MSLSCGHVTVPGRGGVYLFVRDGKVTGVVTSGTGSRGGVDRYVGMPIAEARLFASSVLGKKRSRK